MTSSAETIGIADISIILSSSADILNECFVFFLVKFRYSGILGHRLYETFRIITSKSSLQTVLFQEKVIGNPIFLELVIRLSGNT